MTHRTTRSRRAGFTLVEVLASLALVAVIMPVAMEGVSLAVGAAGLARDRVQAAGLAEARLNELLADGTWESGDQADEFGPDRPGWRWEVTVENWTDTLLRQVTVTVTWPTRGRQYSLSITTLAYSGDM